MARGMRLPVGVDAMGGAALVEGEPNNRKILFVALGDCENESAFQQDLGIPIDIIFDVNDAARRPVVLRQITAIFREFAAQKRFKLVPESVKISSEGEELKLELKYIDIEADQELSFSKPLLAGIAEV